MYEREASRTQKGASETRSGRRDDFILRRDGKKNELSASFLHRKKKKKPSTLLLFPPHNWYLPERHLENALGCRIINIRTVFFSPPLCSCVQFAFDSRRRRRNLCAAKRAPGRRAMSQDFITTESGLLLLSCISQRRNSSIVSPGRKAPATPRLRFAPDRQF